MTDGATIEMADKKDSGHPCDGGAEGGACGGGAVGGSSSEGGASIGVPAEFLNVDPNVSTCNCMAHMEVTSTIQGSKKFSLGKSLCGKHFN